MEMDVNCDEYLCVLTDTTLFHESLVSYGEGDFTDLVNMGMRGQDRTGQDRFTDLENL